MNKVLLKNLSYLFLLISLFSFSQEEIPVIDFEKGDYPLDKKLKILFDEDLRPTTIKDSAEYYRLITFKDKNIPKGKIETYFKSGAIFSEFYSYYVGLSIKGIDSVAQQNGPAYNYYKNGNRELKANYFNDLIVGDVTYYIESGEVLFNSNYVDGIKQGEEIFYYKSGEKESTVNYVDDLAQGQQIGYYESGETLYTLNYVDSIKQGQQIVYYESGENEFTVNYVDDLLQGQEIGYYESGEVQYTGSYVDDLKQGLQINYLKNGELDYTILFVDGVKKQRRIALVIGNAAYEKGSLENPVNDANLIAKSLEKLDFEVNLYTNLATEDEMLDAIKDFGRKRKNYEIGFVYYAGHGIQLNNENYLLPVNEEFEYEEDVEDNGVSMQRVLRYLESTRENQLNFIVLDACRDNPFESNWNKTRSLKGGGLAKIPPPTGSLIAYSTDHGQTAADGDGGNSLYSKALAEKLLEEDVSIEQVFKNVRTEVLKLSNKTQSPVEESKLTGDVFYLNKKKSESTGL